jgi:hypothetical protein
LKELTLTTEKLSQLPAEKAIEYVLSIFFELKDITFFRNSIQEEVHKFCIDIYRYFEDIIGLSNKYSPYISQIDEKEFGKHSIYLKIFKQAIHQSNFYFILIKM